MRIEEEKLIQYVPEYRTKEQFEMFIMRVNEQISYLKFLKKEAKRKKKEFFGGFLKIFNQ